jgi:hypothetical protein
MSGLYRLRSRHAHRHHTGRRAFAQARARRAIAAGGLGAAALAAQANWAGPAFWPAASDDMLGYAVRAPGYDLRFWGDGFADVLAGIFSQSDDRAAARGRSRPVTAASAADRTTGVGQDAAPKTCGTPSSTIDDIVAQLEQTVKPKPAQQAAFKDLKAAMAQAADDLRRACPGETPLTPLARLNAMQQRLWAMQSAARAVRTPLANLVSLLDDEQKARLNGSATPPPTRHAGRRGREAGQSAGNSAGPAQICYMQSRGASEWPIEEIRTRVRPSEAQEASLKTLAENAGTMAKLLIASCPQQAPASALDRIDAILGRLDTMLYAISAVDPPLQAFYGSLTDEQKARFHSLGAAAGS